MKEENPTRKTLGRPSLVNFLDEQEIDN